MEFPLAVKLEKEFPLILQELNGLLSNSNTSISRFAGPKQVGKYYESRHRDFLNNVRELCQPLDPKGSRLPQGVPCWEEFMLYGAHKEGSKTGRWVDGHCALAPKTCAALQEKGLIGDIGLEHRGISGKAGFVVLHPNSRIAAHTGAHNHRLTIHLGLSVPEASYINVRGERRSWVEGQALVLDDSFVHYVDNPSDKDRVILLAHVWHPSLVASQGGYRKGVAAWKGAKWADEL